MTTKTLASVGLALILAAVVVNGAQARTRQYEDHAFDRHTGGSISQTENIVITKRTHHKRERRYQERPAVPKNYASVETQIVSHPAGCPSRAFCGCGASVEVFGRSIRELWLASNWFRFPPAAPAPGMIAVRRHHVFVIRQVLGGGKVLAYDANSGRRQTRIHVRSLAGYSVRNPHAGQRYAER